MALMPPAFAAPGARGRPRGLVGWPKSVAGQVVCAALGGREPPT
jgi:hypothetical protein